MYYTNRKDDGSFIHTGTTTNTVSIGTRTYFFETEEEADKCASQFTDAHVMISYGTFKVTKV